MKLLPMYHLSPRRNRQAILELGLIAQAPGRVRRQWKIDGQPAANYLLASAVMVDAYRDYLAGQFPHARPGFDGDPYAHDLFEIDVNGLDLHPDAGMPWLAAYFTLEPIPAARITLLEPARNVLACTGTAA